MKGLKWKGELKKVIKSVPYNIVENWDFDAYNKRIAGQFGEFVPDFGNPHENLFVCIDISEPANFYDDYAEIIEYLESQGDIRDKFEKIHFNFWAGGYYLSDPIRIRRAIGLLNKTEGYYKKAKGSIDTSVPLASSIFEPLIYGNNWYRLKPELILVLTKGNIFNDIDQSYEIKIKRYLNKIVWICVDDVDRNYLSTILEIDSREQVRIIFAKD